MNPKSIVIVGGGASATLLLAQLSIQLNNDALDPVIIYVIDDRNTCKGIAYQAQHPSFLLNVIASQMGAYHDKPDDFYQWLNAYPEHWRNLHTDFNALEFKPNDFLPRMIYGAYLDWVFEQAVNTTSRKNISIQRINAKVIDVTEIKHNKKLHIATDSCDSFIVDTVIFATGNTAQKHQDLINSHIFLSPYCQEFLQQDWSHIKNTIIVGSGLSMVDTVQYLEQQNYKGKIHIFSRHGLIPLPHSTDHHSTEAPEFSLQDLDGARKIIRKLREQIATNTTQGISWQKTINAFRKHLPSIWLSLSSKEQKKLNKVLHWWSIARHRIPADIYTKIIELKSKGKLTITKGDIKKAQGDGEYFLLHVNNKTLFIESEKLVICSGYNGSYDNLLNICNNLLPSKEQLKQTFNCNHPNLSNEYSLYALGPCLTDILLETTAIHEIRQQSKIIAADIARKEQFSLLSDKKHSHA